jgi:elongation factor G
MPKYSTDAIRNVALLGGAGAGKTTLVEAMLAEVGSVGRAGRVEDGNTVCDFDDLEKEFGHSFDTALVHFDFDGAHLNVIDTPGALDFLGRALSVLPAVDTAIVVVDASTGIGTVTRRVMKAAAENERPRMIVVNKIDNTTGVGEVISVLQEAFGSICQPVNLPTDGGKAVIDCFQNTEGSSDAGDVAKFHTGIVDQVVETDDALMEQYLEQGEVSPDQLRGPFKKAMGNGHLIPVCFASARENVGIKDFMRIVATLCPNPAEAEPPVIEHGPAGERENVRRPGLRCLQAGGRTRVPRDVGPVRRQAVRLPRPPGRGRRRQPRPDRRCLASGPYRPRFQAPGQVPRRRGQDHRGRHRGRRQGRGTQVQQHHARRGDR